MKITSSGWKYCPNKEKNCIFAQKHVRALSFLWITLVMKPLEKGEEKFSIAKWFEILKGQYFTHPTLILYYQTSSAKDAFTWPRLTEGKHGSHNAKTSIKTDS